MISLSGYLIAMYGANGWGVGVALTHSSTIVITRTSHISLQSNTRVMGGSSRICSRRNPYSDIEKHVLARRNDALLDEPEKKCVTGVSQALEETKLGIREETECCYLEKVAPVF
jgi:hypothetical protein